MTNFVLKNTYSALSSSELINLEENNMDHKRFKHCINVSLTARKLARLNSYDEEKAALAGFIHDYAKQVSVADFRKAIKTQGFDQELLNWGPAIWHGVVGTYFIKRDLKITDPEILTAVRRHTTGDTEMTMLDKIVYMADYIEPERNFDGVDEAREITFANLDKGVGFQLAHTLNFLIENRNKVYPRTLAAYNVWSIKDNKEKN